MRTVERTVRMAQEFTCPDCYFTKFVPIHSPEFQHAVKCGECGKRMPNVSPARYRVSRKEALTWQDAAPSQTKNNVITFRRPTQDVRIGVSDVGI